MDKDMSKTDNEKGYKLQKEETCIINAREKLKETDEYKRAMELEWASRKQAIQIQAEKQKRLKRLQKWRRAESLHKLDTERRQKERVKEVRNSQKKDEENMSLEERIWAEVMTGLTKLGISVGSWPNPSPQEAAYKAGANSEMQNIYGQNNDGFAILDEVARKMVLSGVQVKKHTKAGKGAPHVKILRMVEGVGVLSWGKSSKRNVICREAEVGPSSDFRWNRRMKGDDGDDSGVFRVVTTKNKEIHFSCGRGGIEMARLWVRGIRLVTREAIFGRNFAEV